MLVAHCLWQEMGPGREFDPSVCPELKNYDKKYIYESWRAPISDQKTWGCRVTGDGTAALEKGTGQYPKPMFDLDQRRQICLDAMKHAYDVGLYGNSPTALDGSWKQLFDFDDKHAEIKDETSGSVEDSVTEPPEKRRKVVAHEEENERNTDGDRQHLD
jgi:cryptochrome